MSLSDGPALLFCPGDRPSRFPVAADAADMVILDLEDSVSAQNKARAREAVTAALRDGIVDAERCMVRINPLGSLWGEHDVDALRTTPLSTVMLPKASDPEAVEALAPWSVVALCETAAGVLAASDLAAVPNCTALMWGGEDLTADLGGQTSRGADGRYLPLVQHARVTTLLAAGAAGCAAVDGVYLDIDDAAGLEEEAREAVAMGFAAKVAIHPKQVPWIRRAFAPTPEQVDWATEVLSSLNESEAVTTVGGRMVDEPLLRQARSVLARHAQEPKGSEHA